MIIYIAIGVVSGIISGMGIGGGTILIPALVIFMGIPQRTAQNINLIYFIPTAVIALIIHFKNGNIKKDVLFKIIVFGLLSAVVGSIIAVRINGDILRKMFGFFLLVMGVLEFFKKSHYKQKRSE